MSAPRAGERESSGGSLTGLLWTVVALLAVFELAWLWAAAIFST